MRKIRETQIVNHFIKSLASTKKYIYINVVKERLWTVPEKRNLKRQPAKCYLTLDSILYWKGRNAVTDIFRRGIWTDKGTFSVLNF